MGLIRHLWVSQFPLPKGNPLEKVSDESLQPQTVQTAARGWEEKRPCEIWTGTVGRLPLLRLWNSGNGNVDPRWVEDMGLRFIQIQGILTPGSGCDHLDRAWRVQRKRPEYRD